MRPMRWDEESNGWISLTYTAANLHGHHCILVNGHVMSERECADAMYILSNYCQLASIDDLAKAREEIARLKAQLAAAKGETMTTRSLPVHGRVIGPEEAQSLEDGLPPLAAPAAEKAWPPAWISEPVAARVAAMEPSYHATSPFAEAKGINARSALDDALIASMADTICAMERERAQLQAACAAQSCQLGEAIDNLKAAQVVKVSPNGCQSDEKLAAESERFRERTDSENIFLVQLREALGLPCRLTDHYRAMRARLLAEVRKLVDQVVLLKNELNEARRNNHGVLRDIAEIVGIPRGAMFNAEFLPDKVRGLANPSETPNSSPAPQPVNLPLDPAAADLLERVLEHELESNYQETPDSSAVPSSTAGVEGTGERERLRRMADMLTTTDSATGELGIDTMIKSLEETPEDWPDEPAPATPAETPKWVAVQRKDNGEWILIIDSSKKATRAEAEAAAKAIKDYDRLVSANRDWLDTFAGVCEKLGITEAESDPKQLLSDNISATVSRLQAELAAAENPTYVMCGKIAMLVSQDGASVAECEAAAKDIQAMAAVRKHRTRVMPSIDGHFIVDCLRGNFKKATDPADAILALAAELDGGAG